MKKFSAFLSLLVFSSLAFAEDSPHNDLNALIQTNEQYRSFYILLAVVMVVAFVLLIFFNNREMRKKDRKIYDSAALLKHTIQAQEEERSRLSRELHDGIAQDMRYIVLLAERLKNETETERAESIAKIQKKQTDCIKEIRSLCYNLAPPAIQSGDLNAEFSTLCTAMQEKSDAEIRLIVTEDADFSSYTSEQRLNLYRIVQELLNNAVRHARAEEITVLVKRGKIIVTDDGSGIGKEILQSLQEGNTSAAGNAHFGLRNILERTRLLGGTAHFKSSRETGTEAVIELGE